MLAKHVSIQKQYQINPDEHTNSYKFQSESLLIHAAVKKNPNAAAQKYITWTQIVRRDCYA